MTWPLRLRTGTSGVQTATVPSSSRARADISASIGPACAPRYWPFQTGLPDRLQQGRRFLGARRARICLRPRPQGGEGPGLPELVLGDADVAQTGESRQSGEPLDLGDRVADAHRVAERRQRLRRG